MSSNTNANELNQSIQELDGFLNTQFLAFTEAGPETLFKFPWVHKTD